MFICNKCLKCEYFHMGGSYGPCEICGKVNECVDCPSWHDAPEDEKPKPKSKQQPKE